MRNAVHNLYKKAAEYVLPPLKNSQFEDKRVLTPEEFVAAGDYLVRACPTWAWEGGDPKKRRPYLPDDKQFLITRGVPCLQRASAVVAYDPNTEFSLAGEEEGWTATHNDPTGGGATGVAGSGPQGAAEDIPSIDDDESEGKGAGAAGGRNDDDDVPDITELDIQEQEDDEAALPAGDGGGAVLRVEEPESSGAGGAGGLVRTRTYDLAITYDQFYQVPRLWLVGYDESKRPLASQQVLEDVSEEHARKTITVEAHPHVAGVTAASIHPCRHAEVMKKLVDNMADGGKDFAVQHYLVLFLKFIASVVPTIQYDYTMSVGN